MSTASRFNVIPGLAAAVLASAAATADDFNLTVPLSFTNLTEDVERLHLGCGVYESPPSTPLNNYLGSLGFAYVRIPVPSNGTVSSPAQVGVTFGEAKFDGDANAGLVKPTVEGKSPHDATAYRCVVTVCRKQSVSAPGTECQPLAPNAQAMFARSKPGTNPVSVQSGSVP